MRPTLAVSAWLLLSACSPSDWDGDGLANRHEERFGTDPRNPDTDGDGISDGVELLEWGLDPLRADTDEDGFDDLEEYLWGSDPLDWGDYPWDVDAWPDNAHRVEVIGNPGYDLGDQVPNLTGVDQRGNEVGVHQFWGKVVLIDVSTGWCGPSRTVASEATGLLEAIGHDELVIVHAMMDDNQRGEGITDPSFIEDYAREYDLAHPVIAISQADTQAIHRSDQYQGGIPFLMLLDRDLVLVEAETGGLYPSLVERIRGLAAP